MNSNTNISRRRVLAGVSGVIAIGSGCNEQRQQTVQQNTTSDSTDGKTVSDVLKIIDAVVVRRVEAIGVKTKLRRTDLNYDTGEIRVGLVNTAGEHEYTGELPIEFHTNIEGTDDTMEFTKWWNVPDTKTVSADEYLPSVELLTASK